MDGYERIDANCDDMRKREEEKQRNDKRTAVVFEFGLHGYIHYEPVMKLIDAFIECRKLNNDYKYTCEVMGKELVEKEMEIKELNESMNDLYDKLTGGTL